MAYPFTGSLNSNEIYNFFNMIISQEVFPINVATPELADKLRVDGTLYGDTKLYHSVDVTGSYDWQDDTEASNLLAINRNASPVTQAIKLDTFRQTNTTVDYYLSKRAFMGEGAFADFTGTLLSVLGANKRIYDNGIVNTFVGTQVSSATAANVEVVMTDIPAPTDATTTEAYNRIRGQRIAKALAKLARELKDNRRDFNELSFLRSVDLNSLLVVWNGDQHDNITMIDLPTIFHKDGLYKNLQEVELPGRYFGTVSAAEVSLAGARAMYEFSVGADHYFPGDVVKTGSAVVANSTYIPSTDVICKIFPIKAIPFMSAFQVGTSFMNPRSLTENHYLTWGHNTLERIKEFPFVTIKVTE